MDLGSLSYLPKLCLKFKCDCIFVKHGNENSISGLQMEILPKPTTVPFTFLVWECLHQAVNKLENENETTLLEDSRIVENGGL